MAQLQFNAHEVEPFVEFTPLPAGKYQVVISASDIKRTKKGDGSLLELTFTVIEGEYANRKAWARLNIHNPSADAQRIGKSQLSAVCRAVGVMTLGDSSELHNIPLVISVGHKPRGDGNGIENEIKGYAAVEASTPATAAPANPAPPATVNPAPQSTPSAPTNAAFTPPPSAPWSAQ